MDLTDKISIITGAGSGIGRASALLFSKKGSIVIVADLNEQKGTETVELIREQNGQAIYKKTNVTDAPDVKKFRCRDAQKNLPLVMISLSYQH